MVPFELIGEVHSDLDQDADAFGEVIQLKFNWRQAAHARKPCFLSKPRELQTEVCLVNIDQLV